MTQAPNATKEFQVVGPPGTGKTTSVVGTYDTGQDPTARNITRGVERYGGERIWVCSFTRSAAEELVSRDLPLPRDHVGTMHSIGYRLLGAPPLVETKKGLEDWNAFCREHEACRPYVLTLDDGAGSKKDEPSWDRRGSRDATVGDKAFAALMLLRAQMTPQELWPMSVRAFSKYWEAFKQEAGCIDFADMIERPYREHIMLPGKPAMLWCDEAQDLNALQQALARLWGSAMESYVMVGDPDQTIFGFQGADPNVFLDHPVPEGHRKVLSQSYRVPRSIHAWAEAWIKRVSRRQDREYLPRDAEGEVVMSGATWMKPGALLPICEPYWDAGKEVMFLTSCGYMLGPLKTLLRSKGIPFHNPYRKDDRQGWNPLSAGGVRNGKNAISAAERVLAFLRPDKATFGQYARSWCGEDVQVWADVLSVEGIMHRGMKAKLKELSPSAEVTFDNMLAYFEDSAIDPLYNLDLTWFRENLVRSKADGLEYALAVAEKQGGQALRGRPHTMIGTGHSVKGGEAPVVVLFPDLSGAGMQEWSSAGPQRDAVRRLFYVMATRASEALVLCQPAAAWQAVSWR